jgi:hypothetical protein
MPTDVAMRLEANGVARMPKSVAKQSVLDDSIQSEDIETTTGGTRRTRDVQPGAFLSPGRAFGDVPAWAPRDGHQHARWDSTHFETDCNDSHNVINSHEAVLDIVAVIVETDELEREVRQRISSEAQIARVETRDGSEITLRRRYIALVGIILAVLITIIGVFAGTIRKPLEDAGDSGQVSEAPPALETVLEDDIVRCGISERLGFGMMNETKGSREGFEVDLVRSLLYVFHGHALLLSY